MTTKQRVEYHVGTKRTLYHTLNSANITAKAVIVDGYVLSLTARGWDLTKNICELYGTNGYIRTAYTYSPYGQVTATGNVTQPIQWSSEYHDTELGLVYYNYRHYNPVEGRWLGRDRVLSRNLYIFCNNGLYEYDYLGLISDEELYSCLIIKVKTYVRYLLFGSKEIEWYPGINNSISKNGYKFYRYPRITLEARWKDDYRCNCMRKKYKGNPCVEYRLFFLLENGSVEQKYTTGGLTSNTLLGIPYKGEINQSAYVGYSSIGYGLSHSGIAKNAVAVRIYITVGSILVSNEIYYL